MDTTFWDSDAFWNQAHLHHRLQHCVSQVQNSLNSAKHVLSHNSINDTTTTNNNNNNNTLTNWGKNRKRFLYQTALDAASISAQLSDSIIFSSNVHPHSTACKLKEQASLVAFNLVKCYRQCAKRRKISSTTHIATAERSLSALYNASFSAFNQNALLEAATILITGLNISIQVVQTLSKHLNPQNFVTSTELKSHWPSESERRSLLTLDDTLSEVSNKVKDIISSIQVISNNFQSYGLDSFKSLWLLETYAFFEALTDSLQLIYAIALIQNKFQYLTQSPLDYAISLVIKLVDTIEKHTQRQFIAHLHTISSSSTTTATTTTTRLQEIASRHQYLQALHHTLQNNEQRALQILEKHTNALKPNQVTNVPYLPSIYLATLLTSFQCISSASGTRFSASERDQNALQESRQRFYPLASYCIRNQYRKSDVQALRSYVNASQLDETSQPPLQSATLDACNKLLHNRIGLSYKVATLYRNLQRFTHQQQEKAWLAAIDAILQKANMSRANTITSPQNEHRHPLQAPRFILNYSSSSTFLQDHQFSLICAFYYDSLMAQKKYQAVISHINSLIDTYHHAPQADRLQIPVHQLTLQKEWCQGLMLLNEYASNIQQSIPHSPPTCADQIASAFLKSIYDAMRTHYQDAFHDMSRALIDISLECGRPYDVLRAYLENNKNVMLLSQQGASKQSISFLSSIDLISDMESQRGLLLSILYNATLLALKKADFNAAKASWNLILKHSSFKTEHEKTEMQEHDIPVKNLSGWCFQNSPSLAQLQELHSLLSDN